MVFGCNFIIVMTVLIQLLLDLFADLFWSDNKCHVTDWSTSVHWIVLNTSLSSTRRPPASDPWRFRLGYRVMSRQISQLLPPDPHHALGASPQFGSCSQFSYSHSNGHFHSGINLKTHSVKSDPRKDTEMKGEFCLSIPILSLWLTCVFYCTHLKFSSIMKMVVSCHRFVFTYDDHSLEIRCQDV